MRIALVVFRYGPSHGSILQTWALTKILESLGHNVTIIDRQRPVSLYSLCSCLRRIISNIRRGRFSWYDFYLKDYPSVIMSQINNFIDHELRNQTLTLTSDKQLQKLGRESYEAYVVGSDQTWRPKYVYDIYNYFLNFVPKERKVRRIAYATSFGTSEWEYTSEQEIKCKGLVRLFDGVSVREIDGLAMCKDHFGIDVEHVVDPTMLFTAADYMKFIKKEDESQYLICNYLDFTPQKIEILNTISEILDLPVRQLITMGDFTKEPKERIAPSIEDWLTGIANSDFAVIDSFHATVFCILFHKNFVTIGNEERGMSRFKSLLCMVGLEDRLIVHSQMNIDNLIKKPIIWKDVDERLSVMRERSYRFLVKLLAN